MGANARVLQLARALLMLVRHTESGTFRIKRVAFRTYEVATPHPTQRDTSYLKTFYPPHAWNKARAYMAEKERELKCKP